MLEASLNYFRTNSLALCPYLSMNELKYVGAELSPDNKVIFIFEDPKLIGRDLELAFNRSRESQYKKLWRFFRGEVDSIKRKTRMAKPSNSYSS